MVISIQNFDNTICNECINHIVNVNDVENSIKKSITWQKCWFDGLTSEYLINASPLYYVYSSHLYTIIVLPQNNINNSNNIYLKSIQCI